jgi:hypothetical protein
VTKLFSSCKSSGAHKGEYGAIVHCMKNIPSENQIQVILISLRTPASGEKNSNPGCGNHFIAGYC